MLLYPRLAPGAVAFPRIDGYGRPYWHCVGSLLILWRMVVVFRAKLGDVRIYDEQLKKNMYNLYQHVEGRFQSHKVEVTFRDEENWL